MRCKESSFAQTCQTAKISQCGTAVRTRKSSYDFYTLVIYFMWDEILKSKEESVGIFWPSVIVRCVNQYDISSIQCSAVPKLFAKGSSFAQTCQLSSWLATSNSTHAENIHQMLFQYRIHIIRLKDVVYLQQLDVYWKHSVFV